MLPCHLKPKEGPNAHILHHHKISPCQWAWCGDRPHRWREKSAAIQASLVLCSPSSTDELQVPVSSPSRSSGRRGSLLDTIRPTRITSIRQAICQFYRAHPTLLAEDINRQINRIIFSVPDKELDDASGLPSLLHKTLTFSNIF